MNQKRILVPTKCVHDWKHLLADPELHWEPEFSAMSAAYSWENADGLPPEIADLLQDDSSPELHDAELLFAIPEYKVPLKGGHRPSQNDVFVVLSSQSGLVVMTVEAKSRENFDKTLKQWRNDTSEKGYKKRLGHILENIGLGEPLPDSLRYQLLHRAASAVIEAKRFHARTAIMVVQSFVSSDKENHFDDYVKFIAQYGQKTEKNHLIPLATIVGIRLFSGWVQSVPDYSERKRSPNNRLHLTVDPRRATEGEP